MTLLAKRNDVGDLSDQDLIDRAIHRDPDAVRSIIKRYNQRLYRMARSVLGNNCDAEDVVQEAYLRAFNNLSSFRGESSLSTWLSRITLNEALCRVRERKRQKRTAPILGDRTQALIIPFPNSADLDDPERTVAQRELLHLVERATDELPPAFRVVFMARVIEGLTLDETAELLGLEAGTVKSRLHRARKLVKERLEAQIGPVLVDAFPFAGERCDRLVRAVLARLNF